MTSAQQSAKMIRVKQNPSENEHHYVRTDSLSDQPVFVLRCYAFQESVFCEIVSNEINDDSDIQSIVSIWIGNVVFELGPNIGSYRL